MKPRVHGRTTAQLHARLAHAAADIGKKNIFWSADQAIVAAEAHGCAYCKAEQQAMPSGLTPQAI